MYNIQNIRASVLKNVSLSYFTIPKSYFINYTIPFYNIFYIQKLYYFTFSLKYYFFNLSLLFLSYHQFFSAKRWNKIYIFFSIVLQYNSKLELYCSTIVKNFAIVRYTIFWCKYFLTMKCQKSLRYSMLMLNKSLLLDRKTNQTEYIIHQLLN